MRYPVNLSQLEKEYARRICNGFKQGICGFDILRSNGKTYVCDVNGFSFVKTSDKYYFDCAIQLKQMILSKTGSTVAIEDTSSISEKSSSTPFRPQRLKDETKQRGWELRSVVSVFRHGDRTPKQKMKMKTSDPIFLDLF